MANHKTSSSNKVIGRKRIPIANANTQTKSENDTDKNVQKEIWKFYIQAKRKYIQRLSSPIKIIPSTWQLKDNGTLKVEIDPTVNNDELFNLIKRFFTSGGIEPKLEFKDNKLSYFTVSTANTAILTLTKVDMPWFCT